MSTETRHAKVCELLDVTPAEWRTGKRRFQTWSLRCLALMGFGAFLQSERFVALDYLGTSLVTIGGAMLPFALLDLVSPSFRAEEWRLRFLACALAIVTVLVAGDVGVSGFIAEGLSPSVVISAVVAVCAMALLTMPSSRAIGQASERFVGLFALAPSTSETASRG